MIRTRVLLTGLAVQVEDEAERQRGIGGIRTFESVDELERFERGLLGKPTTASSPGGVRLVEP